MTVFLRTYLHLGLIGRTLVERDSAGQICQPEAAHEVLPFSASTIEAGVCVA